MRRPTFADPKIDFAFKRIFGSEEHKDVLVAFLNDMLGLDAPHRIRLIFFELPKHDASRPPQTVVEKWAYFFREADNLTVVPEVLAEHPFIDALEAARTAGFTAAEWDAYILAGMAIQNERGALAVAERRGREEGLRHGI